jgi:hypothetical protein
VGWANVRPALFVAAALAVAAIVPFDTLRAVLATAAGALLETVPFLAGARLVLRIGAARGAIAYLGCGCSAGPSARSLPAAAATWLLFGPAIAVARLAAAIAIARLLPHRDDGCAHRGGFLDDLSAMLVPAVLCGVAMQAFPVAQALRNPLEAAAAGALLGFAAAPCALGGVALAGTLHACLPAAAAAFLCVAGLLDARTFLTRTRRASGEDAFAYALCATASGCVALRGGAELVHPAIAAALGACAVVMLAFGWRQRRERNASVRFAPALMLAGALITAPAPVYRATETTLAGAFPGERVTFLGVLSRDGTHDALVRFAIVCCRADASPVALRLASRPAYPPGSWLRAEGTIAARDAAMVLVTQHVERAAPPSDPFVYR